MSQEGLFTKIVNSEVEPSIYEHSQKCCQKSTVKTSHSIRSVNLLQTVQKTCVLSFSFGSTQIDSHTCTCEVKRMNKEGGRASSHTSTGDVVE